VKTHEIAKEFFQDQLILRKTCLSGLKYIFTKKVILVTIKNTAKNYPFKTDLRCFPEKRKQHGMFLLNHGHWHADFIGSSPLDPAILI